MNLKNKQAAYEQLKCQEITFAQDSRVLRIPENSYILVRDDTTSSKIRKNE